MSHQQGLSEHECREHLEPGGVGRVALHTPSGLMIYPVNFTIDGRSIVFRTTTESTFGYSVVGADVVFETDYVNFGTRQGWSVVVTGSDVFKSSLRFIMRGIKHKPLIIIT